MPANPVQLHAAVTEIGRRAGADRDAIDAARQLALGRLESAASSTKEVATAVADAAGADPGLRCASPTEEDPAKGYPCPGDATSRPLLAVDGSQAFPDRHDEVLFALINVATIAVEPGSRKTPAVSVNTRLLFGDDLRTSRGTQLSEGDLSLIRDAAERSGLLAYSSDLEELVALIDGPLELWGAKEASDPGSYERALRQYVADLQALQRRGTSVAGYVDKPAADLVLRMLECWRPKEGEPPDGRRTPLWAVTDRWLFESVLKDGERSAVFELQSSSAAKMPRELGMHFFYLNSSRGAHPYLARVEIPRWVAASPPRIAALHRALLDQCSLLGDRPYPYVLHRAHEAARVSPQEKEQIKARLLLELRGQNSEVDSVSPKSSAKLASGGSARL